MNLTKMVTVAFLALVVSSSVCAGTIALWNYNTQSTSPNPGTGSMAIRGGLPSTVKWDTDLGDFDPTRTENDSSDPAPILNDGTPFQSRGLRIEWSSGWSFTDPPGTQAVIWRASTAGYSNVKVRMDVRWKFYNPRYFQLQYSTDGITFITHPTIFEAVLPMEQASWFNHNEIDLSGIPAAQNNPNFAFAFIMAYGPGKTAYEPSLPDIAFPVEGKSIRVGFDMVEVYTGASSIPDTTPPQIMSIHPTEPMPDPLPLPVTTIPSVVNGGDDVYVVVTATDNAVVRTVTANGVSLSRTGLYTWAGYITASTVPGSHAVNAVATDDSGNVATDTSGSYTTASTTRVFGVNGRGANDQIMVTARDKWLFKVWGVATRVDSSSFDLDDGSGSPVRVFAPGYTGIATGDYASARGVLGASKITSNGRLVSKLE